MSALRLTFLAAWIVACGAPRRVQPVVDAGAGPFEPTRAETPTEPGKMVRCISQEATQRLECPEERKPGADTGWWLKEGSMSYGSGPCGRRAKSRRSLLQADVDTATRALDAQLLDRRRCASDTASLLLEGAMKWHVEAVGSGRPGTGDRATMQRAAELYELVLASFAPELLDALDTSAPVPLTLRIRNAHADLLFFLKRWAECGPAFDIVADNAGGSTLRDASVAAVMCYRNDKAADPLRVIAAMDRLVCVAADPETRADARWLRAKRYFDTAAWEQAAAALREIAFESPPDLELGTSAATLYLLSLRELSRQRPGRLALCSAQRARDLAALRDYYCTTSPCALPDN